MQQAGAFLVARDAVGDIAGCVFVDVRDSRGYFGLLSVDPSRQHLGIGRSLVDAAEARARAAGCVAMDIRVVNLRAELPAFYQRLGYAEIGVETANEPRALRPFHFVRMSKAL
jgi:GNAT superfamily N-acetyltransferase